MGQWGGVERLLSDMLLASRNSTVRHILICPSASDAIIAPLRRAGVSVFTPPRAFRYDVRAIWSMREWLRREGADIVHSYNAYANPVGALLRKMSGITHIAGEHGTVWSTTPPRMWLDRWAQKTADAVIANSEATRTQLRLRYGIPTASITVVHNAVPPLPTVDRQAVRHHLGFSDQEVVIGSIGRLCDSKGFEVLVAAAPAVLDRCRSARFLLVGGGPREQWLRERIQRLGIADRFVMTGWRDDARSLVQAMDLFVSTSIWETFGNVLVEAALAGIPVVAPAIDGIPEVVAHGLTGRLLRPTEPIARRSGFPPYVVMEGRLVRPRALSPIQLADEITALVDDPVRRAEYGQAALCRARTKFSLDRYIRDLESLYSSALGARGS